MNSPSVAFEMGPPATKHILRGIRLADRPVGAIEVLMHRYVELEAWQLKAASDAFWRLYWPLQRGGEFIFQGQKQRLEPGFLYLIPQHTNFDTTCSQPFRKWYIHFTTGGFGESQSPGIFRLEPSPEMRRLLNRTCPKDPAVLPSDSFTPLDVLELISLVLSASLTGRSYSSPKDSRTLSCLALLHKRLAEKLTLKQLAAEIGVSERKLSELVVAETGFPPMRYLIELRLNHSMKLLRHTQLSIEEIAQCCGFPNRHYFSRMFAKHRVTTPALFRRQTSPPIH